MFEARVVLLSLAVFAVSAQLGLASNKLLSSYYQEECIGPCRTSYYGGNRRHDWCRTKQGWDYCSKVDGEDFRGNKCTSKCEKAEESYNWCRIASGSWGYCSVPDPTKTCWESDMDYNGGDIGRNDALTNATACQHLCMATANCLYWTFYDEPTSANKGCWLKDQKKTSNVKALPKATSGPRLCGEGLDLGIKCNYKSPPCVTPNAACITYRCKCVNDWVRYPRNGQTCVAQDTLELDTPCTNPGSACSASNSECRAYRCACKSGFSKSASGDECEAALESRG